MSWSVPTLLAPGERFPPSDCRNVRSRFAPPGTNGTMMVNSDLLPRRAPTRPALSIGCGRSATPVALYCRRWFQNLRRQLFDYVLQRLLAHFRRVGEQVPQLLNLLRACK